MVSIKKLTLIKTLPLSEKLQILGACFIFLMAGSGLFMVFTGFLGFDAMNHFYVFGFIICLELTIATGFLIAAEFVEK